MSDYLPKHKPGEAITLTATAVVAGGQVVTIAGAPAGADSVTWLGVASQDAAIGQRFGVYLGGVQRLTASAAIAAGALVKCAAAGQIVTHVDGTDATGRLVGIALEAAAGAASVIPVVPIR